MLPCLPTAARGGIAKGRQGTARAAAAAATGARSLKHAAVNIPLDPSNDKDVGTWLLQHGGSTKSALEQLRQQGHTLAAARVAPSSAAPSAAAPSAASPSSAAPSSAAPSAAAPSSAAPPMGLPDDRDDLAVLFERVRAQLGLELIDAAENMLMSKNSFVRVCRSFGIARWPQARQIAMLRKALEEALAQSVVAGNPGSGSGGDNAAAVISPQQQEQQQHRRHHKQQALAQSVVAGNPDSGGGGNNAMSYTTKTGRVVKRRAPADE